MPHTNLRELAFQMRSKELREYGRGVLERDPTRVAAAEVLDLMAYLIECDFVGAQAKIETIQYRFQGSKDEGYVAEATTLAKSHIDFAFGRFDELLISARSFLDHHDNWPTIEEAELLDVLRLLAHRSMFLDENDRLAELFEEISSYKTDVPDVNKLYLINSVYATHLLIQGDMNLASEVAERNIAIAKQNKYTGIMAPLDSMYVLACCKFSQSNRSAALDIFQEVIDLAQKLHQWPWYFMTQGIVIRDLAYSGRLSEALALLREQRNLLSEFTFKHNLDFIPDVNELYVRTIIGDIERIEIILSRVPDLIFVRQVKALLMELQGKDVLKWIEALPEKTYREKIYKNLALAEYYQEKESVATGYMYKALEAAEKSGNTEAVIRQDKLLNIVLKAIALKPSVFLEQLASKMTDRVKNLSSKSQEGITVPLTTRELEVVRHLATGKPISAISTMLHVSMNTMKTHLRNIYRKLEVDGREKAVERAKELFLI